MTIKKKISIAKIRTNFHELHSETGHCSIHKMPWYERVCHLCDTKKVEDEKQFLLNCPTYTQIRSHFQNICHTTNLPNLLTQHNAFGAHKQNSKESQVITYPLKAQ
jgi:hypothetical protein